MLERSLVATELEPAAKEDSAITAPDEPATSVLLASHNQGPSLDMLHQRARESGIELRRTVLSLAAGAIGLFFFALTTNVDPPITFVQKVLLVIALFGMTTALVLGVRGWKADGHRHYFWAKERTATTEEERDTNRALGKGWRDRMRLADVWLLRMFWLGVGAAVIYTLLRLFAE